MARQCQRSALYAWIVNSLAIRLSVLAVVAVGSTFVSWLIFRDDGGTSGALQGEAIVDGWDKPDFTLTDENGEPFDLRAETEGYVTALYFGYTHCPDICPTHMADVAFALEDNPSLRDEVKVVFVSVDPARDDSARLKLWLDLFDEGFTGLTGTSEEIDSASKDALGDLWRPFATFVTHGDDYTVSHPAFVVGYGLDNKARVIWQLGTPTDVYANDIQVMINEGSTS